MERKPPRLRGTPDLSRFVRTRPTVVFFRMVGRTLQRSSMSHPRGKRLFSCGAVLGQPRLFIVDTERCCPVLSGFPSAHPGGGERQSRHTAQDSPQAPSRCRPIHTPWLGETTSCRTIPTLLRQFGQIPLSRLSGRAFAKQPCKNLPVDVVNTRNGRQDLQLFWGAANATPQQKKTRCFGVGLSLARLSQLLRQSPLFRLRCLRPLPDARNL